MKQEGIEDSFIEFIDVATPTFDRCLMDNIDYNDIQRLMLMKPHSSSWKTVKLNTVGITI